MVSNSHHQASEARTLLGKVKRKLFISKKSDGFQGQMRWLKPPLQAASFHCLCSQACGMATSDLRRYIEESLMGFGVCEINYIFLINLIV